MMRDGSRAFGGSVGRRPIIPPQAVAWRDQRPVVAGVLS